MNPFKSLFSAKVLAHHSCNSNTYTIWNITAKENIQTCQVNHTILTVQIHSLSEMWHERWNSLSFQKFQNVVQDKTTAAGLTISFSELSLKTWWSCRLFLQEDFRAVDWTWLWNVATTRYQSILIYRMARPKCTVFSAERNYAKQMSLFDNLVTVVPIACDCTFTPCNPVPKTFAKFSGEISFTNFRISARSSSVIWKQEPGSSRFKQRKMEKSDGAISREYGGPWANLTHFCDTKSRRTLAVWHRELSVWMTNLRSPVRTTRWHIGVRVLLT
jgi:hypothetical protein